MSVFSDKNKPIVLMDCDGVVCDFTSGVDALFKANGLEPPPHSGRWDMERLMTETGREVFSGIKGTKDFCRTLKPYEGAKEFVTRLQQVAYVRVLTAPWTHSPHWYTERVAWCLEHIGVGEKDVITTNAANKELVSGDFLIEDKPSTAAAWQRRQGGLVSGGPEALLLVRPWNYLEVGELGFGGSPLNRRLPRLVSSYEQIYDIVQSVTR